MTEKWTKAIYIANNNEIIEFNDYEISDYGNIRRRKKDGKVREKKLTYDRDGYMHVCLHKNNKTKTCTVHRLVLSSFQTNQYFPEAQADHINSIRTDNRLENLRWATRKENCNNEHHKEALSKAMKGKKLSNDTKQKISEAHKGMKHSAKTKQKIGETRKGMKYRTRSCFYDDKEFSSISEAYRYAIEKGLFNECYTAFRKMIKKSSK